ncbi:MAG: hypothetical protein AAFY65_02690 [Pseudomonadota bacterium]
MRGVAFLFLAALAPVTVSAQTIFSGEHEDFSRLVFPAAGALDWDITQEDGSVRVVFSGQNLALNTAEVFAKIPRTRLTSVAAVGNTLTLVMQCACDVSVRQIPSDHIVIDILDGSRAIPDPEPVAEVTPPALPLQLPATSSLAARLRVPDRPRAAPSFAAPEAAPDQKTENAPQITIHEHARVGLLDGQGKSSTAKEIVVGCALEDRAADLLLADPVAALKQISVAHSTVLNEDGAQVDAAVSALADAYLEAGWGAEAQQVLGALTNDTTDIRSTIAVALDGDPDLSGPSIAATETCGPASTTLMLISGARISDWDAVDETALVRFIDQMSDARRRDLEPRLLEGLTSYGQEDLLLSLGRRPELEKQYLPATHEAVAAGTDQAAIRAALSLISNKDAAHNVNATHLQNAIALLPSIPPGQLRAGFERTLARTLLLTGHFSEMEKMLQENAELAPDLLAHALEELPREDILESAVRLRPFLRSDSPEIDQVVEVFLSFDLLDAAQDFRTIRTGEGLTAPLPQRLPAPARLPVTDLLSEADKAWVERSFQAIPTANAAADRSPRHVVADVIVTRNADAPASDDDFAFAETALAQSREMTSALRNLMLDEPDV